VTMTSRSTFWDIQRRAVMLEPTPMERVDYQLRRTLDQAQSETTRRVDDTLEDSFPASDPPSWTSSVARLRPTVTKEDPGAVLRLPRRVAALF
jgi:hypothetical protein